MPIPCFHRFDGTVCSTVNPWYDLAQRRLSSFDGPKPTVTKDPTRRDSRLDDESPSQPGTQRISDRTRPFPPSDLAVQRCGNVAITTIHHTTTTRVQEELSQANRHSPHASCVATPGCGSGRAPTHPER